MVDNIFTEVALTKDAQELERSLRKIEYFEMFEPLLIFNENWFPIAKYIIYAYSHQSEYLHLGDNWDATKRRIADAQKIPKDVWFQLDEENKIYLFEGVVTLRIPAVTQVIFEYLNYQGNRDFTHLTSLKESYQRFISSPFKQGVDDDQVHKNMGYAAKLLNDILEYEERIRQKWGIVTDGKEEVERKVASKARRSLSLENKI